MLSSETALSTREKLLRAKEAAPLLARLTTAEKDDILLRIAQALETDAEKILQANAADLRNSSLSGAMLERLTLNPERVRSMVQGVRDVVSLPDPIGQLLAEWTRPNGLQIRKLRVPLGVIGIIYESRPNVTVDTIALALKTGNTIVLRGGKEAYRSNAC
ncbi:MAG: aldehyde dehydrogenase family protein, partial [Acidobacteriales bacterium]|nr:aldehyde dehydrogenase family protein [Terriglobales bacterium]